MTRNIDDIRRLLDLYMEGENSQEELSDIEQFFRETRNLPEDLEIFRSMFEVIAEPSEVPTQEELDNFCKANCVELSPVSSVDDKVQKGGVSVPLKPKIAPLWWRIATVAASVILVIILYTSGIFSIGVDEQKQLVDNDTTKTNVVQEVERAIYDTPRYEMAKVEPKKAEPKAQMTRMNTAHSEQDDDEDFEDYDESLYEEDNLYAHEERMLEMAKEDMEEFERSVLENGNAFFDELLEMAASKNY